MLPEINFNRPGLDTIKFLPPTKIGEQCFSLVHKENLKGCTWQYPANIHKEAPFERGPSVTLLSNEWKGSELYKVLHHEYDHQQIETIRQFLYIDWHRRFQRRNYFIQFEFINYFLEALKQIDEELDIDDYADDSNNQNLRMIRFANTDKKLKAIIKEYFDFVTTEENKWKRELGF